MDEDGATGAETILGTATPPDSTPAMQAAEARLATAAAVLKDQVALVLAQTAVDVQTSPITVVAELARQAINGFQPVTDAADNRRKPHESSDEGETGKNKKTKQASLLTLADNNHSDIQAMRRKLKQHPEVNTDVYSWLDRAKDPLFQEFRRAFSEKRNFAFMQERRKRS